MVNIYYFEKATIGYCKECDEIAIWTMEKGLVCPKCKTKKLSLFVWDEKSPEPE